MIRGAVFAATLAALGACGKDPILEAAEEAQAEEAARAGSAGASGASGVRPVASRLPGAGAPAAEAAPAGAAAGVAAPADGDPEAVSAVRKVPSTLFDAPAAASPGVGVPEDPTPAPPGQPQPGVPSAPAAGTPTSPTPVAATPTGKGVPGAPTPVKPQDPLPGRPSEPAPGLPGSAPPTQGPVVSISGTVRFKEWSAGKVRVTAFDADHQSHPKVPPKVVGVAQLDKPGAFSMSLPASAGKTYIEATVDVDGDGRPGRLEPVGIADRYPVTVGTSDVTGVTVEVKKVAPPPGGVGEDD